MDEKYLEEVRDHQSEMIEFMKIMAEINRELVKADELDEFMAEEVESEARKELQKETEKEKSNNS